MNRQCCLLLIMGAVFVGCRSSTREAGSLDHLFLPTDAAFWQVSSFDTSGGNRDRLEIAPGDSAILLDVAGPGIVRRLWLTVSSGDPHYLRRIGLRMYWDGESEPSVAVPLGDFFGNGFDKRHYTALPMGVSSGGFYSYLPMPFRTWARIVVDNGTGREIDAFYFNIGLERVARLPADVETFHAWWHRNPRTDEPTPHVAARAHGWGKLVGLSLNAEAYDDRLWFLEGDESVVVDGEVRGHGTGTEDYFNAGWYFDQGPFAAPYHGVIVKDDDRGRIAAYRWHIPDPIPFRDSLLVTLEHGHGNEVVADYATVAYWYQREPHDPMPAIPPADDRRILGVKIPPGALLRQDFTVENVGSGRRVVVPVPRPDRYEIIVYPIGVTDEQRATFTVPGGPRRTVSLQSSERGDVLAPVMVGTVGAVDTIELGMDGDVPLPAAVHVRPVRDWASTWNVVGPFANPRVLGTETSPAVDSVYGPERDPSLGATYTGAEGRRVGWRLVSAAADGQVRLNPHFEPSDWVAAYAQAFLFAPRAQDVTLLVGADDAHVLWVNDVRVSERQGRHISQADELAVTVPLRAGWNRVVLKVADLDGGWAFQVRAADPQGTLRWSAEPR